MLYLLEGRYPGMRQLTVQYRSETVQARIKADPAFAEALLREATDMFLNGEAEAARLLLRDVVNATVGFEQIAPRRQIARARACIVCFLLVETQPWKSLSAGFFGDSKGTQYLFRNAYRPPRLRESCTLRKTVASLEWRGIRLHGKGGAGILNLAPSDCRF